MALEDEQHRVWEARDAAYDRLCGALHAAGLRSYDSTYGNDENASRAVDVGAGLCVKVYVTDLLDEPTRYIPQLVDREDHGMIHDWMETDDLDAVIAYCLKHKEG
jgi:hypothetical protein